MRLDVGLDRRGIVGAAPISLQFAGELLALDLGVAFEGDAVDETFSATATMMRLPSRLRVYLGEEARGIELLDAWLTSSGAGAGEVGADGLGVDLGIALDYDAWLGGLWPRPPVRGSTNS